MYFLNVVPFVVGLDGFFDLVEHVIDDEGEVESLVLMGV